MRTHIAMYFDDKPDDLGVRIAELLVATSDAADPQRPAAVPEVLRLLRARLGMDVAFASQICDGQRTCKTVDCAPGFAPIDAWMPKPLSAAGAGRTGAV